MRNTKAKRSSGPSVFMAIATFNPSFTPLRGKVGGLVFKRYRDKVVVTRAPMFSKPWSPAQQAARTRFAEASAYARTVQADPVLRASYALIATRRGLTIRSVAISAYLHGRTEPSATTKSPPRRPPPIRKTNGNGSRFKPPVLPARRSRPIPRQPTLPKRKCHGYELRAERSPDTNLTIPPKIWPVLLLEVQTAKFDPFSGRLLRS